MRTVPTLLVTLLVPVGLVTTEATSELTPPADAPESSEAQTIEPPAPEPSAVVERPVSLSPSVSVAGADAKDRARLDQALARFHEHGLALPDVEVLFSDDRADCGGHAGLFESSFTPWRLSICSTSTYVPYHELAHAWEAANVDDDTRDRYLEARGLTNWNDPAAGWPERGIEDAARIIQQNLMYTNAQVTLPTWIERLDAYELLVGRPSPLLSKSADTSPAVRTTGPETEAQPVSEASESGDVAAESSFSSLGEQLGFRADLPEPVCVPATGAADLTAFFDLGDPIIGADYQRAFTLPDGRVIWLFQDAFLPTPNGPRLVHNVGLLQSGQCFQLLRNGSADAPTAYLLPELTDRFDRWFWPLGGGIGLDGDLHVFVAEVRENGAGYLDDTEPVATWLVSIDAETLAVVDARPAPNPSAELYGWSVVSDGGDTYLYAHCYRQFGWDAFPFADPPFRGHDWTCGPEVTVARIPHSDFAADPEYWSGSSWTSDPADAVPVIPREGRSVNPTQVAVHDGRFIAVTKVGDWWGDTIYLDVAPAAEGPWRTYATVPVAPECDGCNTYFASIVPYGADDSSFVVGVSVNTWGGDDLQHYSPTFLRVPTPGVGPAGSHPTQGTQWR